MGTYKEPEIHREKYPSCGDPVVDEVCSDLRQRSQFGQNKYGVTLHDSDISILAWYKHHYTELLDAANYAKKIIRKLEGR